MKQKVLHIITWFLLSHTLLLSVGLPLHTRICRMPDMPVKKSFFVEVEDCCKRAEHHRQEEKKPKPVNPCCTFEDDFLQFDFEKIEPFTKFSFDFQFLFYISQNFSIYYLKEFIFYEKYKKTFFTDTSPPFLVKTFLALYQIWRI